MIDGYGIEVCLDAGEDGGNVEASGAIVGQSIPMRKPFEATIDHPTARQNDEASDRLRA